MINTYNGTFNLNRKLLLNPLKQVGASWIFEDQKRKLKTKIFFVSVNENLMTFSYSFEY